MRLILAVAIAALAAGAAAAPRVEVVGTPPPFTYWAPTGARIEPHPTNPGVWISKGPGGQTRYYFGDACGASKMQSFVGRKLDALPPRPAGAEWRFIDGAHNQDLRFGRLNVFHDAKTRVITEIACH